MLKTWVWCVVVLLIFSPAQAYVLDLSKAKAAFLAGDYKGAIKEGEKVMEETEESPALDELYYLLGVSYFKDGNYLRASDIFEIIISEFKGSIFSQDAAMGLADTYYMRGSLDEARRQYEELVRTALSQANLDQVYYRLSMCAVKSGDTVAAVSWRDKIKEPGVYAQGGSAGMNTCPLFDGYYTVQVGSFSQKKNALNLQKELEKKGFLVFVESENAADPSNMAHHRVRVGKYSLKKDADDVAQTLRGLGYPVKLCP